MATRIEKDSLGEVEVPADALWGAQTQRAVNNFPISGRPMPERFIRALAEVKRACALANEQLGLMDADTARAIVTIAERIASGEWADQFPVDIFQTGSGTSTNMNMNEVIARAAAQELGVSLHPNDHVNMSQSSNDTIPTAIHVSAAVAVKDDLLPALDHLIDTLARKAEEVEGIVKTGRTHLMDAMPVTLAQELDAWKVQLEDVRERLEDTLKRLVRLPQGGTAVGTGVNADPAFGPTVAGKLAERLGLPFVSMDNYFVGLSSQDTALELSGQLNVLAAALMKIANDLRWMNSGPLAGLAEIQLPALQPGSSIMPGKVNPVIPEAVAMVCAQITGNHAAITVGAQSGNFQLNVMLPMIAANLLESLTLATNAMRVLTDKAVSGFTVNRANLEKALEANPILVTALNRVVGYELGARIAKTAYAEGRPVLEVAREMTDLDDATLRRLLDPARLTRGGTPSID
ncbi:aspartate ammonia-lyase [Sulfurivirga sp.]|uniref:class II fumarate hydratase n=1 Tax=Sulfurivirga sp. TaxID=2614236 RepID=UPI0025DD0F46|nr:class II fumarate hydratase [Sulfurivirga sp.]